MQEGKTKILAAGLQAAYGDYRGTNGGLLSLNAVRRRILTGQMPLDPQWLRLAENIAKQCDRPLDFHAGSAEAAA